MAPESRQTYRVHTSDVNGLVDQLNLILQYMSDRLDKAESLRGTARCYGDFICDGTISVLSISVVPNPNDEPIPSDFAFYIRSSLTDLARFESTDPGSGSGPNLELYRNSDSPADNDFIGRLKFVGNDSSGSEVVYCSVQGRVDDVTDGTEDATLSFNTIQAGTIATKFKIAAGLFSNNVTDQDKGADSINVTALYSDTLNTRGDAGIGEATPLYRLHVTDSALDLVRIESTDTGLLSGPNVELYRDATAPDLIGRIKFMAKDSGGTETVYCSVQGRVLDAVDTSEDAELSFNTTQAGTAATRFKIGLGLYSNNATGGDKGDDSLNVVDLYSESLTVTGSGVDIARIESTDAGSASGPNLDLVRNSASPIDNDFIARIKFIGKNDGGSEVVYGGIGARIVDANVATGTDGFLFFNTTIAGTSATRFKIGNGLYSNNAIGGDLGADTINALAVVGTLVSSIGDMGAGTTTPAYRFHAVDSDKNLARIESTNTDNLSGPNLELYRNSASPANNDFMGRIKWEGENSIGTQTTFAAMGLRATVVTSGSEDGLLFWNTIRGGSSANRMLLGNGLYTANANNGDKGADTINAISMFDADATLGTSDFVLEYHQTGQVERSKWPEQYHYRIDKFLKRSDHFDLDKYTAFWKANHHLPGLESREQLVREHPSLGNRINSVVEELEVHAIFFDQMSTRIRELEKRIEELEARLS